MLIPPEQRIPWQRSSDRNLVTVSVSGLMTEGEMAFAIFVASEQQPGDLRQQ